MKTTAPNQRRMVTELFDHTADLGLECTGSSMADLLERAGEALGGCVFERSGIRAVEERVITADGSDPEELLVNFLREVLFLINGEAFLPKRLAVVSIGDRSVSCRVDGEPRDPERHAPIREIKAVTYHGVTIEESRGMLTARVVLDV